MISGAGFFATGFLAIGLAAFLATATASKVVDDFLKDLENSEKAGK
jgi:hypothetical protein